MLLLKQSLQDENVYDNEFEASSEASVDNINSYDFMFGYDPKTTPRLSGKWSPVSIIDTNID